MIVPNTIVRFLKPNTLETLGGSQFAALSSVVEVGPPKVGFNLPPDVVGPAGAGVDFVVTAGAISAAPGRAAFWARVLYTYENNAEADAAAQAAADLADNTDKTDISTLLAAGADRLAQIKQQAAAVNSQATTLSTITLTGTQAQQSAQIQSALRQIGQGVALLAAMHSDEADYLKWLGRNVARARGVPLPAQGLKP